MQQNIYNRLVRKNQDAKKADCTSEPVQHAFFCCLSGSSVRGLIRLAPNTAPAGRFSFSFLFPYSRYLESISSA